jgi:two-component system sensor histidine kinase CiaH
MVKSLRKKFVMVAMISVVIVILAIIGAIYAVLLVSVRSDDDQILKLISQNEVAVPKGGDNEGFEKFAKEASKYGVDRNAASSTRFFEVTYDANGNTNINLSNILGISEQTAEHYADQAVASGKDSAYIDDYKYVIEKKDGTTQVIFLNCFEDNQTLRAFLTSAFLIGGMALVVMFLVSWLLSPKAIAPYVENMERQKQFITDASHELKTPLSIISADSSVLEMELGENNKWIRSIHHQIRRMDQLIKDLLTLSKSEEMIEQAPFASFDISGAVESSVNNFEALADSQKKTLTRQIEPGLMYKGNQENIEQLTAILIDNAIKYTPESGEVTVTFGQDGKHLALKVTNPCQAMSEKDLKRIFDRFYRTDSSRARNTGGYGIGLSIASTVVDAHKGKISAEMIDDSHIQFQVML